MNLYKVTINMPVHFGTYYVVAGGFDEAVELAQEADLRDGGDNGGVDVVEIVGHLGPDGNLCLNDQAAKYVAHWL